MRGAYRLSVVLDLIKTGEISLVRGNQSEIKAIYDALSPDDTANNSTAGKGVDGAQVEDSAVIAYRLARFINCPVVATGEEDYVSDGTRGVCRTAWSSYYDSCNGNRLSIRGCISGFL